MMRMRMPVKHTVSEEPPGHWPPLYSGCASQAPGTSPTLPQPAPSQAQTLEAWKGLARLAQAPLPLASHTLCVCSSSGTPREGPAGGTGGSGGPGGSLGSRGRRRKLYSAVPGTGVQARRPGKRCCLHHSWLWQVSPPNLNSCNGGEDNPPYQLPHGWGACVRWTMWKMRTVQGLMGCTLTLLSPQKHACEFGSVNCHFQCSI